MTTRLGASLCIYDQKPDASGIAGQGQLWRGGVTDRASRGISARDGARWLSLVEFGPGDPEPRLEGPPPILAWRLEQLVPGALRSPTGAGGVVLVSMNVDAAVEDEFNDWYTTEHIPLLSRVPGMISARRFRALNGNPRYVALYHVTDIAIYASDEWTSANETPWMLRMRRFQSDRTYFMFPTREDLP